MSQQANDEKEKLLTKPTPEGVVEDDKEENSGNQLLIAFLLMLVFQLGNRIFSKLSTYPMYNYPLFTNLLSTVIYVPICFAYIIPIVRYSKNIITQEQLDISKWSFFWMGAFDSLAGIMGTFAVNYIPSAGLIVLVQQSAIPISMGISSVFLQARYTYAQYSGAFIVCIGIFVVLIPTLFDAPKSGETAEAGGGNQIMWIIVLVLSCVPMCLSSVYKEKALGEVDIDVVYLNGWVAVFQSLVAIPLSLPTAAISGMSMSEIIPNLVGGARCLVGINTILEAQGSQRVDQCEMAPLYVWIFLAFNVVYNVLIVVILKLGSANIMWMASTVIVPLSNVVFSLHFVPNHRNMQPGDIAGLFVIMIGLVVYRFMAPVQAMWRRMTGSMTAEELAKAKAERKIAAQTERRTARYVGITNAEPLQTLLDSRIWKEQMKNLLRTPQQIRGNLLVKLGIPPSPKISMGSRGEVLGKTMRLSSSSKPETIEEGSGSKMKNFSYEAI